jgi:hypothetical protein
MAVEEQADAEVGKRFSEVFGGVLPPVPEARFPWTPLGLLTTGVLIAAASAWPWAASSANGAPRTVVHGGFAAAVIAGVGILTAIASLALLVSRVRDVYLGVLALAALGLCFCVGLTITSIHRANALEGVLMSQSASTGPPSGSPAAGAYCTGLLLLGAMVLAFVGLGERRLDGLG